MMTPTPSAAAAPHRFTFFRSGEVDQVAFVTGADVVNLPALDQKLWIALACPTRGLDIDARTLELLDTEKDGRLRPPEILAAVAWMKDALRTPEDLLRGGDTVALAAIDERNATGRGLLAGARRILHDLGKPEAGAISLADVQDTQRIFAATRLNGDGVIIPETADDPGVRRAIEDVMATHGPAPDRSGKPGVSAAKVEAFFAEAEAFAAWHAKGDPAVFPIGEEGTTRAEEAVAAVRVKVEDYFARCRLAAFDPRAAAALGGTEAALLALAGESLTADHPDVARLPLARIEAGRPLPLAGEANPAWTERLRALAAKAAEPLLGRELEALAEPDWRALLERLAAHEAWLAAKPATAVEQLGIERIRELARGGARAAIGELIRADAALEPEVAQISAVEKLLLLHRDLLRLLNNFVNFSDFFRKRDGVFQAGRLFMDGRTCALCLRVDDAAKHAALAGLAKTYLAYCDCVRPHAGEKMTILAAFTDGDADRLMVGRNGIFYDRKGRDWDATIVRVVENPISVREAFWAPYKRFVRLLEEQVAKRAAAADVSTGERLAAAAQAAAHADRAGTADAPAPRKIDVGTVAALGVAVGGLATFFSSILAMFFGLGRWLPFGIVGLLLAISGPSMLIAWLKLRQRNLGPILDASGWAVNGRVRINVPFGSALTDLPVLPSGSARTFGDPYAVRHRPWRTYAIVALLLALAALWAVGRLDALLPERARSTTVLEHAPWR